MICCVPLLSMGLLQYMSLYIYIRHGRRSPTIFLSFFVDSATKPATDATSLKEQQQQQQQPQREAWQTTTARAATTVSDRSLLVSLCLCTESKGQARKRGCCEFHKQVEKGLHLSINQSIDQSIDYPSAIKRQQQEQQQQRHCTRSRSRSTTSDITCTCDNIGKGLP